MLFTVPMVTCPLIWCSMASSAAVTAVDVVKDLFGVLKEDLAGFGQLDAGLDSVEKNVPKRLLELLYLHADCGL